MVISLFATQGATAYARNRPILGLFKPCSQSLTPTVSLVVVCSNESWEHLITLVFIHVYYNVCSVNCCHGHHLNIS